MLFENSGHDTIFPMDGNERIRARLERLYGFYTNRTDRLFDIAVTPGGHEDNPELRLMAYRWINRFLKNDNAPVTEPELQKIDGVDLRAFPDELPADEVNTNIDEYFVPVATNSVPRSGNEFRVWQREMLAEWDRLVFRRLREKVSATALLQAGGGQAGAGILVTESGMSIPWKHFPGVGGRSDRGWLVVIEEDESLSAKPDWLKNIAGDAPVLMLAPRGNGPTKWNDPAPYYIQRSLPLLGRTVDSCRLFDVLTAISAVSNENPTGTTKWSIAGRGQAGVIAAYAALLDSRVSGVVAVEPPASHRNGPIFLNILRVIDVPEAFGLLAPRPLSIFTSQGLAFEEVQSIYRAGGGTVKVAPWP
jgi:hypothetical protein